MELVPKVQEGAADSSCLPPCLQILLDLQVVLNFHRAMSTPLPKVDSPLVQRIADEDPNFPAAYNVCLSYEIELPASKTRQRHITTLGPLLLYAPNQDVCTEVTQCINSSETDNNLSEIGAFFERYVILACESPSLPSLPACFCLVQSQSPKVGHQNLENIL